MIILIWCSFLIQLSFGASVFNCPTSNFKFEKVLGLRPPNSTVSRLLYQSDTTLRPVTSECIAKCLTQDDCSSFVLFYSVSKCYYFTTNVTITDDSHNVIDENVAWFIKKCLKTGTNCSKLWTFERIPGATLIGNDIKVLPKTVSRTDCQQFCLNETQFDCRSAKFSITQAAYSSSTENYGYTYGSNNGIDYPHGSTAVRGTCVLSDTDRHQLPSSYRVSSFGDEYFENQCAPIVTNSNEFCAYEEYENMTSPHNDMMFERKSKEDCQKMCDTFQSFNCRSFTIINGNMCYLHSEDTKIYGPNSLRFRPGAIYYEKANCLNISVTCTETYMTVNYKPEVMFGGKMYMEGYSDSSVCSTNGQGGMNTLTLQIPLLSGQCGIAKAGGPLNRTLLSGNLLLQFNSLIQTQNDRLIRVGCIFGNETKIVIGTGVHVSPILPNRGNVIIIPGDNATVPNVIMRVLDLSTGNEVSNSQIGQELQLQIILNKPENLDIWASHLIAMTEKNDESIFLIDDRGCPADLNVFPPLKKIKTKDYIQLVANFKAFKFTDSPIVRFSVIIQFCVRTCPPINCGGNIVSHGRRKRELTTSIKTINQTTVVKQNSSKMFEMPLEYIMVVRDSNKYTSDRLVVGDNKILIAGYDILRSEVCLDYSLVIALIILWILIQVFFVIGCVVLVRRYKRYYQHECTRQSLEELHKNFGLGVSNLDNKRVHWADNENIL